jgi:hypothetical protein
MKLIQNQPVYFKQDGAYKVKQSVSIDKTSHNLYFTRLRILLEDAIGEDNSITISSDSKTIYWIDRLYTPDSRAFRFSQEDLVRVFKDCLCSAPTRVNELTFKHLVDIEVLL